MYLFIFVFMCLYMHIIHNSTKHHTDINLYGSSYLGCNLGGDHVTRQAAQVVKVGPELASHLANSREA